jgi:hypothetical protein
MRTGRSAGVAVKIVCNRRTRFLHFYVVFEIQLAPDSPVVKVISQFHPPAAAVFFFNLNQLSRENF